MRGLMVAVVVLAGCVAEAPADEMQFTTQDWSLVELDGKPFEYQGTINLGTPGSVNGKAPCNSYFATFKQAGKSITFSPINSTRMACSHMQAETAFLSALQGVTEAELSLGRMTLRGGGHELFFNQPVP